MYVYIYIYIYIYIYVYYSPRSRVFGKTTDDTCYFSRWNKIEPPTRSTYMRNLLGWLETRLAQITLNDLGMSEFPHPRGEPAADCRAANSRLLVTRYVPTIVSLILNYDFLPRPCDDFCDILEVSVCMYCFEQ